MIRSHGEVAAARIVTHVTPNYPPSLGGMEQVVQSLARYQYRLGMQVRVLTSDQGRNEQPLAAEPFSLRRLRSISIANTPLMPGLLPQLFALGKPSIIHLHISAAYTPEIAWAYARLRSVNYLAHVHLDVLPSGRAGVLLGPYKRLLLRPVLRDAAAVLVPTDDYRQLISSKYGIPLERIVVIPNGTDHRITDRPKTRAGQRDCPRLLFVGRLAVQKNIPLLIRSIAAYVARHGSDIRLVIVGAGELRSATQAQIDSLGLSDIVSLRGALHGAELEAAYEDADLLVLTSTNESFGLVFIEAMTKGLPIVSVNIPAVRDVVIHGVNGLLAEPTPEAVAGAVHALLADEPLYSAISRNNVAKSRDYAWSVVVEEIAALYDAVLGDC